jgi:hypothetical protein
MTEEQIEVLAYELWAEFSADLGSVATDSMKYAFIAGARSALHAVGQSERADD